MGSECGEIDLGNCKLAYLRENWYVVAGRNLPNTESEGYVGDS